MPAREPEHPKQPARPAAARESSEDAGGGAGGERRKPTINDVLDLINDYRIGGLEQVLIGMDVLSAKNSRAEQILYARRNAASDLKQRFGDLLSEQEIAALVDQIEEEIRRRRPD